MNGMTSLQALKKDLKLRPKTEPEAEPKEAASTEAQVGVAVNRLPSLYSKSVPNDSAITIVEADSIHGRRDSQGQLTAGAGPTGEGGRSSSSHRWIDPGGRPGSRQSYYSCPNSISTCRSPVSIKLVTQPPTCAILRHRNARHTDAVFGRGHEHAILASRISDSGILHARSQSYLNCWLWTALPARVRHAAQARSGSWSWTGTDGQLGQAPVFGSA